jgi:hypothetical protein
MSHINCTKIPDGIDILKPKKPAFTIETDPDFIKLHCLMVSIAKRGGGKTLSLAHFLKKAREKHYFDRIILITPTYNSNKHMWDICGIEEEDVIEPEIYCLKKVIDIVNAEKQEWDEFEKLKKQYKNFKCDMSTKAVKHMNPDALVDYEVMGFFENPPKWKYPKEHPPRVACVIDDFIGTDICKPRAKLVNLCIRHRHIADGLGVSLFLLAQTYCAIGGIPRAIRENTTHLLLFKNKDEAQMKKIHSEIGQDIDLDRFEEMRKYCTEGEGNEHGFLMVDFHPQSKEKSFRRNFEEYLN